MSRRDLQRIVMLLDALAVCVASAVTWVAGGGISAGSPFHFLGSSVASQVVALLLLVVLLFLLLDINHLYKFSVYVEGKGQLRRLLLAWLAFGIVLGALEVLLDLRWSADHLIRIGGFLVLTAVLLVAFRMLLFTPFILFCYSRGRLVRRALVVGAGAICDQFLCDFAPESNPFGIRIVGVLDDELDVGTVLSAGIPVVGRTAEVTGLARQLDVQEILVASEEDLAEPYFRKLDRCTETGACVTVGSRKFLDAVIGYRHDRYGRTAVFTVCNSGRNAFIKRYSEPVLAAIALLVVSPFLLLIAVAVKLDSKGPVLFKQIRIGKNGRPFEFYKFRSMYVGSDNDKRRESQLRSFIRQGSNGHSRSTKIVDNTKITRVGRILRKTSIDELPQMINVVRGDMSLVGPRPPLQYEWESYEDWHRRRLNIVPGCTGVWQVLARSKVGFHEMVAQDLFYAYKVSPTLDVWLMLKTIPVMLFGKGGE